MEAGRRDACDLLVEAGDAFDVHAVAMLLAAGADAVHPWLALQVAGELGGGRGREDLAPAVAEANALAAIDHGLRKVLARMGISTLASYRGAQLFDVLGLADEVADRWLPRRPADGGRGDVRAPRRRAPGPPRGGLPGGTRRDAGAA